MMEQFFGPLESNILPLRIVGDLVFTDPAEVEVLR